MKLTIKHITESNVFLDTEISLLRELSQRFQFRTDNYMFSPMFKTGKWDGYIKLINSKARTAPKGLVPDIIRYCKENGYTVKLDDTFESFGITYKFDHEKYQLPFTPHDYQLTAVQRAIDKKRQILISPTGCLHPDTEIEVYINSQFSVVKLKELSKYLNQDLRIDTVTGRERITDVYTKTSEGTQVIFEDGTQLIGSINHLVWKNNDWKRLADLKENDIITNKKIQSISNYPVTNWIDFTVDANHQSYIHNGIIHHNSGKSVILYLMMREFLEITDKKILIIVPSISLVSQIYNDFKDYSVNNGFNVEDNCHMICEGENKTTNKRIIISTYQSIYKEPMSREQDTAPSKRGNLYFEDIGAVICDECHTAKSESIKSILDKCIYAFFRIGLTGTLDGTITNEMVLKGLFGPVHRVANTTDLMDRNILAKLKINFINLKYNEETCIQMKHADYRMEMDWLVSNPTRNKLICNLANKLKGNTLILVQYIEKHGKVLNEMLKEACKEKQVYFVYGKTESEERELVRKIAEKHSNVIILASYQVFSTGVNIKNLPNIIFGSPTKSKIRLLQSIGRGVRLHDDKDFCRVVDLCDDLRYTKRKAFNYVLKHAMERLKMYYSEGFEVIEMEKLL